MVDIAVTGEVYRTLNNPRIDGTSEDFRLGRYREIYVLPLIPTTHLIADEGSYFVTANATPGTGITAAINATVSETAGNFLLIKNNDSLGNPITAKRVYLDYIKIMYTSATLPASATSAQFFIKLDSINRYTSGGTQLFPMNINMDVNTATITQMYAGALTTVTASPSARLVARGVLRSVIPVVQDTNIINCGSVEFSGGLSDIAGTTAKTTVAPIGPVIIGPQQCLCLQLWWPANAATAGILEVEVGHWER